MRKTIVSIMIMIAVMMNIKVPSFAAEYPDAFWGPNVQYEQALINNAHLQIRVQMQLL